MIGRPLNDAQCLGQITQLAVDALKRPDVQGYARRFQTKEQAAAAIRRMPQQNDTGDPADGPRVACDTPQRVRILPANPNCVERSLAYLVMAEILEPATLRQLVTIDTPYGRHTYPVENGWQPVVLDPLLARNMLDAGVFLLRQAETPGAPPPIDPVALLAWLARIACEPAWQRDGQAGVDTVERARVALAGALAGRGFNPARRTDVLYALDRASEAADCWGESGRYGVRVARAALAELGITADARNACGPCSGAPSHQLEITPPVSYETETRSPEPDAGGWHSLSAWSTPDARRNFSLGSIVSAAKDVGHSARRLASYDHLRKGGRAAAQRYGLGEVYDSAVARAERAAARLLHKRPEPPKPPDLRTFTDFETPTKG